MGRGITAPQNAVLLAVAGNPRISNAELARTAFVTPQTMQGILANLERGGLIARNPHPQHGRIIMTALTTADQKAVAEGAKAADMVERQMLSMLACHGWLASAVTALWLTEPVVSELRELDQFVCDMYVPG